MKITKQRLKEIIKEEISSISEGDPQIALHELENQLMDLKESVLTFLEPYDAGLGHEVGAALAGALGGVEGTLSMINNTLVEVERAAGAASELDPDEDEGPRVTSTGPWAPEKLQEEGRTDQGWLAALKQKYGRQAAHFTVNDIQKLHSSYRGSLINIAKGLGIR